MIEVPSDIAPETDLQSVTIRVTRLDAMGQPIAIPITEQTVQIGRTATEGKKTIPVSLGVFAARGDDSRRVLVTVTGRRMGGVQAQTSAVVAFFPNKTVFYTLYLAGACTPAVNTQCEAQGQACGMQGICVDRIRSTAQVLENGMRRDVPVPPASGPVTDVPDGDVMDGTVQDVPTVDLPTVDVSTLDVPTDVPLDRADAVISVDIPSPVDVPPNPAIPAPRPIAPMSTSMVSSHQPVLKWALGAGSDGAVATVCRNRAMTDRCQVNFSVAGTSLQLALPPGDSGWFYWALTGTNAGLMGNRSNVVWQFWVRPTDPTANRQTVFPPPVDFDGDGFVDVAVGAPHGQNYRGSAFVYRGSMVGLVAAPAPILSLPMPADLDLFGSTVASAGDLNGDGFTDLAVGASGRRAVSIYYGAAVGIPNNANITLTAGGQPIGSSISTAGDVNGDGFGDLVVNAPGEGAALVRTMVYLGGAGGLAAAPHVTISGPFAGDQFAPSVSGGGDINGDGYGDIVVGVPRFGNGGVMESGIVTVYYGSAMGLIGAASHDTLGVQASERLGQRVALVGDLNGDGFADVVAAAPGTSSALVLLGRGGSAVTRGISLQSPGDPGFPTVVASGGDLNNDGLADLIATNVAALGQAGKLTAFLGTMGAMSAMPTTRIVGVGANNDYGYAVAGIGDVNNDGFGDVLVGATLDAMLSGSVFLYRGVASGLAPAMGGNPQMISAPAMSQGFGFSVAALTVLPSSRRRWLARFAVDLESPFSLGRTL